MALTLAWGPRTSSPLLLERNCSIERVALPPRPAAVEYRIAPVGSALNGLVDMLLLRWTAENIPLVASARARFDAEER